MAQTTARADDLQRELAQIDEQANQASEGAYIELYLTEINQNMIKFNSRLSGLCGGRRFDHDNKRADKAKLLTQQQFAY